MKRELEETRRQGTAMRPLQVYHMRCDPGAIDVPFHWHENAEILLMQTGTLALQVEAVPFTGRPGDVFFINPRELHGMQSASADCAYLAIVFPLSWLQFALADEAEENCLRPLADRRARVTTRLDPLLAGLAAPLLTSAAELAEDPAPAGALGAKAALLALAAQLYRAGAVRRISRDRPAGDPLRRIAGYLQQHCGEAPTQPRRGEEFHMSPKYFSSYFQKRFARNFSDYLTAVRIERAKTLLQQTDAGVEWVAQQAAFRAAATSSGCSGGPPAVPPGSIAAAAARQARSKIPPRKKRLTAGREYCILLLSKTKYKPMQRSCLCQDPNRPRTPGDVFCSS